MFGRIGESDAKALARNTTGVAAVIYEERSRDYDDGNTNAWKVCMARLCQQRHEPHTVHHITRTHTPSHIVTCTQPYKVPDTVTNRGGDLVHVIPCGGGEEVGSWSGMTSIRLSLTNGHNEPMWVPVSTAKDVRYHDLNCSTPENATTFDWMHRDYRDLMEIMNATTGYVSGTVKGHRKWTLNNTYDEDDDVPTSICAMPIIVANSEMCGTWSAPPPPPPPLPAPPSPPPPPTTYISTTYTTYTTYTNCTNSTNATTSIRLPRGRVRGWQSYFGRYALGHRSRYCFHERWWNP